MTPAITLYRLSNPMKQHVIFWVILTFFSGCATAPIPYLKGKNPETGEEWNADETGRNYCYRLSSVTDSRASTYQALGVGTSLAASALIILGGAMGPDTSQDANWFEKNRNSLTLGGGSLLAIPAALWLMRSQAANTASAKSSDAMGHQDDKAMTDCLAARAEYVNARSELAKFTNGEREKLAALRNSKAKDEEVKAAALAEANNPALSPTDQQEAQAKADEADARIKAANDAILATLRKMGVDAGEVSDIAISNLADQLKAIREIKTQAQEEKAAALADANNKALSTTDQQKAQAKADEADARIKAADEAILGILRQIGLAADQ